MAAWIHVGLLQSKSEMMYLPKKVCLIIIHRKPTHILNMSCCHKHNQQRYHNENTKIYIFLHYMYADILFPLTKAVPIMFEYVTIFYIHVLPNSKHMNRLQHVTISSTRYHTYYHMLQQMFSLSLTWISHNATCYYNSIVLFHTLRFIFFLSVAWSGAICNT